MNIALAIFKYFPAGGAQRDLLALARELAARGHRVRLVAGEWLGERPDFAEVTLLPVRGWSNHARARSFARLFAALCGREAFDRTVGFNRLPGLDFYFAADLCFAARGLRWRRLLPRARTWLAFERAVFAPESRTRILALTPAQIRAYQACYDTPEERFRLLPPGVGPEFQPVVRTGHDRLELLLVAADFHTKGADRALRALARMPLARRERFHLTLLGDQRHGREFQRLADRLELAPQVTVSGPTPEVARRMAGADVLLHPARREAAGNVLAEAVASALPVICTECCGYADLVAAAGGIVLPEPFEVARLEAALLDLLNDPGLLPILRQSAWRYAQTLDYTRRPAAAAEWITA